MSCKTPSAPKKMQALLGTTAEVMIEGKTKDGLVGRTGTNRLVHLAGGPDELLGSLLEVEITEAGTWSLQGRIIGGGMGGLVGKLQPHTVG